MPRKKKAVDSVAETVTPAVETVASETPKRRGRKPGSKNKPKESTSRKATAPVVILQYGGKEVKMQDFVEKAKADYKTEHPRAPIFNCSVYVKPEEGMVYYVINKTEGKFPLE